VGKRNRLYDAEHTCIIIFENISDIIILQNKHIFYLYIYIVKIP
jgi:hypothetical protein